MASQLAILATIYFASVELSAMEVCFWLNQDIITDPKLKKHLEVLFVFDALPSQYVYILLQFHLTIFKISHTILHYALQVYEHMFSWHQMLLP